MIIVITIIIIVVCFVRSISLSVCVLLFSLKNLFRLLLLAPRVLDCYFIRSRLQLLLFLLNIEIYLYTILFLRVLMKFFMGFLLLFNDSPYFSPAGIVFLFRLLFHFFSFSSSSTSSSYFVCFVFFFFFSTNILINLSCGFSKFECCNNADNNKKT